MPKDSLDDTPYARDLGVRLLAAREGTARLAMPYDERNTAVRSMHGGAIASLAALAARAALPEASAVSTVSLHVLYARGARGRSFTADARLIRTARELGFVETHITDQDGEVIATASATLAGGRDGREHAPAEPPLAGDPGVFNTYLDMIPFLARRGLRVTGVDRGRIDIAMPPTEVNLDRDGTIHEGAALTLIDGAGANCPWTLAPISADSWGSTVALHAQLLGPLPADGLVARTRIRASDERMYWCDVSVLGATDRRLYAFGTVVFRLTADRGS
ncbi:MAG: hotdog fold thioesterase [Pseudonocardiaceae bacterium]|nr:hotdog fold thioesterase [Pseudonocardiaceae bacterium]